MDYTGAIAIRDNGAIHSKAYISLFSCAVTRAVHLEVVTGNSHDEFISAFLRFVSRRSTPQIMHSDNATNFTSASKTLKYISNHPNVRDSLEKYHVQWKFITLRAAWHGGMWERLIGIMKSSLKKVMGNALLSLQELTTLVIQIEGRLNDRPLTYVSDDPSSFQPLTSLLMFGYRINSLPSIFEPNELVDPNYLQPTLLGARVKFVQLLLEQYWKRWQVEYLTALRERYIIPVNS